MCLVKFTLTLFNYPDHINNIHALHFAKAIIKKNNQLDCIFLQQNSVYLSCANTVYPQTECNITTKWHDFLAKNKITAYVCITAALKRGIIDKNNANNYLLPCTIAPAFKLTSLGFWLSMLEQTDRLISF